ncbi:MAG: dihydroorotase [Flavobacteriales bacterium]|nr:MAG: dihydroorotase [Flavobacteriales bacterium]CAI8304029.1 MAG: Allantoinase [Flavobacteriales bacterium]
MNKLLIKNATIINENKRSLKDIYIEGEYIKEINTHIDLDDEVEIINAKGLLVIPGMIDDQVHFREPGLTHKGDISSESMAAVAGGVTSYIEMPNTFPNTTSIKEFNKKIETASTKSFANFSFMFGGTNDNISEIKKINKSEVAGVKLFLGSSTGKMLIDNLSAIENIFNSTKLPISAHCEDEQTIRDNTNYYKNIYGEDIPIELHPKIRSDKACLKSSEFAVKLANKTGARLNVFHISTAKELKLFDNKIDIKNKKITAEVCAHHLWFTDNDYKKLGSKIKWNPAIKSQTDKDELWKALKEDKIDIIASDHAPHTEEEKNNKYLNCPSGGPMVQHTILSILQNCENYGVKIEKIVEKIAHNPAIIFQINKRGFLREGYYADIVLIDTNTPTFVTKDSLFYKCGWSPFEGQKFDNSIYKTILNGRVVYSDGKVKPLPIGKKLTFNR